jgi:hypothetical protein
MLLYLIIDFIRFKFYIIIYLLFYTQFYAKNKDTLKQKLIVIFSHIIYLSWCTNLIFLNILIIYCQLSFIIIFTF